MENNLTNKTKAMFIFWWTIKRYIPVSIAYWILLMFSLPIIETFMAIVVTAEGKFKDYIETMKESAIYIAGTGFAGIAVFFSIIVAMIAFSYMHNKRCVDFFGSLPVSRRTMFFARFLAIILLTIIPVVLFGAIGACLSGSFAAAGSIMKVVGYIVLATIGNITIIGFVSLCCGSAVDILISYAAINIAFPICITVFNFFPSAVIPGMESELWSSSIYTLFCPVASVFTMAFGSGKVFGIIWWVALTAITIAASYVVCKKRKAELAQNTYVFSVVEIVVKFIVCALAGLGLGWIMAYAGVVHKSITAQYIYFAIGLVAGILIADILLHLVFHRGLVKFAKSLIQCGIVLGVCGAYTLVIATGLFGYDIDMPEMSEIKSVSFVEGGAQEFWVDGKNVLLKMETDEDTIKQIYDVHKQIIEENHKLKKWNLYPLTGMSTVAEYVGLGYEVTEAVEVSSDYDLTEPIGESSDNDSTEVIEENSDYEVTDATIIYELSDGTYFTRSYSSGEINVDIDTKLFTDISDENLIDVIPNKYMDYMYLNVWEEGIYTYFDIEKNKEKILDALKKDVKTYGEVSETEGLGSIDVEYYDDRYNYHYATVYFNEKYVNTLEALKDAGYSNFKYRYFNELYLINDGESEPTEQSIYFKLPEGMDPNKEVRCLQGYRYGNEYMFNISDARTLCEHVEGDVWKYTLYDVKDQDKEYYNNYKQGIIICQVEEDTVIDTGMILLDKDNANNMLTIGDRKLNKNGNPTKNDYYDPIYEYKWTKYEE